MVKNLISNICFSKEEQSRINGLLKSHEDDLKTWKWVNLGVPIVIILVTLGFVAILKRAEKDYAKTIRDLIFNGSLPLVAVNLCASVFFLIEKVFKSRRTAESNVLGSMMRIIIFALLMLIAASGFYYLQTSQTFEGWMFFLILGLTLIMIRVSFFLSNRFFVLQTQIALDDQKGLDYNRDKVVAGVRKKNLLTQRD